ncbi:VOC family protein [Corallococcus sp. H22C18031201]|nr:VOC family protein [Corallococcus sp. H22C18031201]
MKLNHLDLQVPDVQRSVQFFERYFNFEMCSNRSSPAVAVMEDRHGLVLVLQRLKNPAEKYPEGFHIGFYVEDEALVHEVQAKARADGYEVSDIIRNNRGTMLYFKAPGDLLVEVNCRPRAA